MGKKVKKRQLSRFGPAARVQFCVREARGYRGKGAQLRAFAACALDESRPKRRDLDVARAVLRRARVRLTGKQRV